MVESQLLKRGLIGPEDLRLYKITDDVDEAVREVTHFYSNYHSVRYFKDDLLLRLNRKPTDEQVEENPFGAVAVEVEPDNPFELAADIHDPAAERGELEALLDGATAVVGALEAALERARQQERALRERLARG